jgi:putative intracellular protease/amidase
MFKSDELATKFLKDEEAQKLVKNTVKLSGLNASDFDAIFYVGGHGPIVDLAVDEDSIKLIQDVSMAAPRRGKLPTI